MLILVDSLTRCRLRTRILFAALALLFTAGTVGAIPSHAVQASCYGADYGDGDIDCTGMPTAWANELLAKGYRAEPLLNESAELAVSRLTADTLFYFDGHGNWDVISFMHAGEKSYIVASDATYGVRQVRCPEADLSGLLLAIFNSCKAGHDVHVDGNLMKAFVDGGASCAVGFDITIGTNWADQWSERFRNYALSEGYEVEHAARTAVRDLRFGVWNSLASIRGKGVRESNVVVLKREGVGEVRIASPPQSDSGASDEVATSLVFDVSGSMDESHEGRTKLTAAKDAAQTILDIMSGHSGGAGAVGVATFASDAESVLPLTTDISAVRNAVSGLSAWGMTDMRAGLVEGINQLEASSASDKAMFYLSDGVDTAGNSEDAILSEAQRAKDLGIRIYTVGFGDSGSLDEDLLTKIASTTGGIYGRADVRAAMDLVGRFAKSQAIRSGATPIFESTGVVRQDETAYLGVATVPPDYGDLEVILAWPGSDLDVILVDPAGAQIDEGYPGLEVTKTERTAQVTVAGATPGDWELSVYGTQTSMAEEPFYALAAFRETTGTVPAAGGGTGGNDGSGLLLLLLVLVAGTGIGFLVVGQRRPTASVDLLPDPGGPLDASNESSGLHLFEESTGRRFDLRSGVNAIGRSSDNDIVLADSSVSRHHAVIVVDGDQARVKDLKSTSGVFVEDRRVEGSARLAVGARVKLGGVRLRIESSSPSEEPDRIGS